MADVPRDARLVRIMKDLALTRVARLCEALRASDRNGLRRVRVPAANWTGTDRVDAMLDGFCRC